MFKASRRRDQLEIRRDSLVLQLSDILTMASTGQHSENLENPRPYESCSPSLPTQAVIDTIADAIEMLEGQNLVLHQIVHNVIHDRYQGLSQTSLTNSLCQSLSESMVKQTGLFNLLMNHLNLGQGSQDSKQGYSESLLPSSKLPMDLTKEERKGRSNKQVLPRMDLRGWETTYKEILPREGKRSSNDGDIDQLVKIEIFSQAEILQERMRKSLEPYHQICFKCGERNHLLQDCPSSTWSDPRDWNILSRRGKRIGLSKDFLKSRGLLQKLMATELPFLSNGSIPSNHQEKHVNSDICFNCRQKGHFARDCLQPPRKRQACNIKNQKEKTTSHQRNQEHYTIVKDVLEESRDITGT